MNWSLPLSDPESIGLSKESLDRLDERMAGFVDSGHTAGIITLIARHGKIGHVKCHGMQDMEQHRHMQLDTLFRMYSNTKVVCAVAVLILYEQGLIQLEDPVSKYLPAFDSVFIEEDGKQRPPKRAVTLHDLMVHIGGLSYDLVHHARRERWSHDKFIEEFVKCPLICEPGEQWNYSASHDVLGIVIEKVTGFTLSEFLNTHIFEPLQMYDTTWFVDEKRKERFGPVYRPDENGNLKPDTELNADIFLQEPTFFSLGGGLVSTASDYITFAQMLLNGGTFGDKRILSRKSIDLMTSDHLPPGHPDIDINKERYGLCVEVLTDLGRTQRLGSVGEFGWGGAASTQVWIDPQEDMVALILMQLFGGTAPILRTFRTMSCQAIL